MNMTLCVPCLFGLEGLAADELRYMGMENVRSETGRVLFDGDERALVKVNLWLRTGERVYVLVGEFPAPSFDALFEGTKALPWEQFIDYYAAFPVKGSSLDSALKSIPDCQRIVKKAVAERLGQKYRAQRLPETGNLGKAQIQPKHRRAGHQHDQCEDDRIDDDTLFHGCFLPPKPTKPDSGFFTCGIDYIFSYH